MGRGVLLDMAQGEASVLLHNMAHAGVVSGVRHVGNGVHAAENECLVETLHELVEVVALAETIRQSTTAGFETRDVLAETTLVRGAGKGGGSIECGWIQAFPIR